MKKLLATSAIIITMATAGVSLAEHHMGEGAHRGMPPQMEQALSKLPEAKATMVKQLFTDMREQRQAKREGMKAAHEQLRDMLKAKDFDKQEFLEAAAQVDKLKLENKMQFHQKLADVASKLTAEERAILVEAMPKPGKHHGRRGGKGRNGGER